NTIASCDSFCSLLRAWTSVICPTIFVSLGRMIAPALVRRSCVTLATTSSPVFAFFASMLLVSCTGRMLPGASLVGVLAGAEGAGAAACPVGCACGLLPLFGCVDCAIKLPHSNTSANIVMRTRFMICAFQPVFYSRCSGAPGDWGLCVRPWPLGYHKR